jgi:hypothetical protein
MYAARSHFLFELSAHNRKVFGMRPRPSYFIRADMRYWGGSRRSHFAVERGEKSNSVCLGWSTVLS